MKNMIDYAHDPLNRQLIIAYVSGLCQGKYTANLCIELSNLFVTMIIDRIFEITLE